MTHRPRRSALFLPASNARAIEKARTLAADVVILDLEDAVAPDRKGEARDAAVAAVRAGGFGHRELVVRANAMGAQGADDDLRALKGSGVDAVLLPKVDSAATLRHARAVLGDGPALWAMIETPRAILDLAAIVGAARDTGLAALVAGTNDLAKEIRCRPGVDRAPLIPVLVQIVVAARAAGLVAFDGVSNVLDDEEAVAAECRQGLTLGFDGKTLIHPSQIAPANRVFAPDADAVRWAAAVVASFNHPDAAAKGAIRVEGQMVERLHLEEARRTLAIHRAISDQSRQ
ncbi:malyl-CoA thiolesterase [Sphingomonas sp. Leaf412]|uniref:HpcH/HpaI aldolase/citrate lyase family protein n=1 Tax=Sphingomonas sp. Leaf412 TaxID=1736370 RepID=UPI0006FD526F|nr:CoA ester lyase [Sphingomonas sp. Leaf412]KQT34772.1 malyl-CoA thiolesterase [Sphingomonas sp. Leaf412]